MKFNLLALACALMLAFGLSMGSFAGSIADADNDGVPDVHDNCQNAPNGPLLATGSCNAQDDYDEDGYGNSCDTDFNNDGQTAVNDLGAILAAVGQTTPLDMDLNCDGAIAVNDLGVVLGAVGNTPGPSGLACSAANVKFSCPPL